MTEQELIIQELKDRNINTQSNQNEDDEKELILEQLRERNLFKKTDDGSLLPTPQAQRLDNPYGSIIDDIEIPEMNTRSQAVSDYLKSPEFARLALEVTGGVAGAMFPPLMIARAATLVRPALQQAVTRMAGAGFGQASGAGVSQTFDPTFDSNDDFTEIASDISKDILRAGATGIAAEGVGQVIGAGITKVLSKNKKLLDGADEAIKTIEEQKTKILSNPKSYSQEVRDAVKVGQLTPALLQKGQTIDILENVAESSLFGGGSIRYAKEGAEAIAQSGLDDFLKLYKKQAPDGSLGVLFQKTLTDDLQAFKSIANAKYKAVDDVLSSDRFVNNFQVDLTNLKAIAGEEIKNLGLKGQSSKLKKFLNDIQGENNYITFKRANILRGDFLETSREFTTETLGKKKARLAAIASEEITKAMDNAVVPNKAKQLLADANRHYREGAEVFNDALFKKIINNDPDLVYKSIIAAGDRPTLVKKTFDILDKRITDKAERNLLKNKIRGEFLKDFLIKSQKRSDQFGVEFDAKKIFTNFRNKEDTFKAMFTPKQIRDFKKFENALSFAQGSKIKTGGVLPGAMMIQMKQSGALIQIASAASAYGTGMTGVGIGILVAPAIVARAFTNPKIIRALTLGIRYQDKPGLSRRYFLQAMTNMAADGLISEDELKNIKKNIEDFKDK